jgi:DNA-directed RNA polymerase specialized sigma24 family protein
MAASSAMGDSGSNPSRMPGGSSTEALLEATRRWPVDGVPANPGAWLTTVARNRALNRRRDERRRGGPPLALDGLLVPAATGDAADDADLDGPSAVDPPVADDLGPLHMVVPFP